MKAIKKQRGFLAIVAVVIVVIFGLIAVIAAFLVNTDVLKGAHDLQSNQALAVAESGLSAGTHLLVDPTVSTRVACLAITGTANLTNYVFAGAAGPFTVTSPGPQSPTASTLSSALTANATTIPLENASTYAVSGRIMIDKELINYMGVSGNNLMNAIRGEDGTSAVAHASGAPVGQYQCTLTSIGSAPIINPSGNTVGGQRTLQEVVQLSEGWLVGNKSGNTGQLAHWNKPTEKTWSSAAIAGLNQNLNAVYMLSNADAWAVGNSGTALHWTGTSWTTVASNTNRNLLSVFCTASNNCWAVGATRTADFWDGTTWTLQPTALFPNTSLNSVYCVNSANCWAVGNASGGDVMMLWNGVTWTRDPSRPTPAANLNGVTCVSTSDCWAVGASRTMLRWNGTAWSDFPITAMPNVAYNSIDCVSSNDCWAVGNNSGGVVVIHWNGSTWSRDATAAAAANVDLNGVACNSVNDCWTVGDNGIALHWDGASWVSISSALSVTLNGVSTVGPISSPNAAWQENFP